MNESISAAFINGLIAMGFATAGVFYLRFWVRTRDTLFLAFAAAFWLLALNAGAVVLIGIPREELSYVYLLRFVAFVLIILAVLSKNAKRPGK